MTDWSFDDFNPETDMAPEGDPSHDCDGVPQELEDDDVSES